MRPCCWALGYVSAGAPPSGCRGCHGVEDSQASPAGDRSPARRRASPRRAATLIGRTERPDPDWPPHRTNCSSPTRTARWPTTWATCCTRPAAPARRSWTPGRVPGIAATARADPGSPTGGPERRRGRARVGRRGRTPRAPPPPPRRRSCQTAASRRQITPGPVRAYIYPV